MDILFPDLSVDFRDQQWENQGGIERAITGFPAVLVVLVSRERENQGVMSVSVLGFLQFQLY